MLTILVASLLAAPAAPKAPALLPACSQNELRPARGMPRAGVRKLNEEPPARQLYTVLRVEDGCTKPVPVNDRVIGTTPRR